MHNNETENLESLIAREKRNIAQEYFEEAWCGAQADGIEAETVADALVEGSLRALVDAQGSAAAEQLLQRMLTKSQCGMFVSGKSLQ